MDNVQQSVTAPTDPRDIIREKRLELGLTQEALAHDVGLATAYICRLEKKHAPIGALAAVRLGKYFDIPAEDLCPRLSERR